VVARAIAVLALWLAIGLVGAAEAHLELPDSCPPQVAIAAQVVVEGSGARIAALVLPEVPGLHLERSNVLQQTIISVNGREKELRSFSITADAAGDYEIPAVTVRLSDGTAVATAPATLHVIPADARLTGSAYAEVAFEPSTIVPGQPTALAYRLFLREGTDVQHVEIGPPEGAVLLSKEPTQERGKNVLDAQGQTWRSFVITWRMTFSSPGERTVAGQQEVLIPVDFFNVTRKTIAVKPAKLAVVALPEEGRPGDFTGLIGPLAITATLDRGRISAGEGTGLVIAAAGPQVSLAAAPKLTLPPGLRAYPKDAVDAEGTRTFRWDLVPDAPGSFVVPAISIAYFDPESHAYRRAGTQALTLTVVPGRKRDLAISGGSGPDTAQPDAPSRVGITALPLRGDAPSSPPPIAAPIALALGLVLGLAAALAPWRWSLPRRAEHRGRALAAALARGELDKAAAALSRLLPALPAGPRRAAAIRLSDAIDAARFGGDGLSATALGEARTLEDVP
jgi:hypothetical protein